jgi:hypothetical protein
MEHQPEGLKRDEQGGKTPAQGDAKAGSPRRPEGYCRRSPSTSLGSGPGSPAAAAASSCSSTNLFSSNSSMSTLRKREDSVFRAMAGARRTPQPAPLQARPRLRGARLDTGFSSGSGVGSGRQAPPPPPPRAAAAARPLPVYAGTGSSWAGIVEACPE